MIYSVQGTDLNVVQYCEPDSNDFLYILVLLGLEFYVHRDDEHCFVEIRNMVKYTKYSKLALLCNTYTAYLDDWIIYDKKGVFSIIKDSHFKKIFDEKILVRKD